MNAQVAKAILCGTIISLLLVPVGAIALSPKFHSTLSNIIANPSGASAQFENLKRETPFIENAISAHNTALYRGGISPNPSQMVIGKDGYMFLGNDHYDAYDQITRRYPIDPVKVSAWVDALAAQRDFLAKRGIPLLFIVAPSTGTIYSDKIADWPAGFAKKQSLFDVVLAEAAKKNLPIVDVRPELIAARKRAETYSKLNSHWNDYGAWVAWQKIGPLIESIAPGVHVAGVGDTPSLEVIDNGNEGNGLVHVLAKNEWTRVVRSPPFPNYKMIRAGGSTVELNGETLTDLLELPRDTISESAPSQIRVLAIRDSMGNALSSYFTASFGTLRQINNHVRMAGVAKLDLAEEVKAFKPQLVLYVMTERYMAAPLEGLSSPTGQSNKISQAAATEAWPEQGDLPLPEVKAHATLDQPSSIRLAGGDGLRLLQLEVEAEGAASLYVGFQVGGNSHEAWHDLVAGKNTISIELPEKIDGNYIWIVRKLDAAPVRLVSVRVQARDIAEALQPSQSLMAKLPDSEVWPPQSGIPTPEVNADPALDKPSSVKLAGPDGRRLLQLDVESDGVGNLFVGYQVGGVSTQGWHELAAGKNTLSLDLPEKIDGNYVVIVRDTSKALIKLSGVHVKRHDKASGNAATSMAGGKPVIVDSANVSMLPVSEAWPEQPGLPAPEVKAEPTLSKPSSIRLSGPDGARLVQLELAAKGPTSIYIGYQIGGASHETWHDLVVGKNELTIRLPDKIDGNFIWVVRNTDLAPVSLTRVTVKREN